MRTSPCRPPYAARISMLLTRQAPASLRAPGSARCPPGQLLLPTSPAKEWADQAQVHSGCCRNGMRVQRCSPLAGTGGVLTGPGLALA